MFGVLRAPRACHAFMRAFAFGRGIHTFFVLYIFRMFVAKCFHARVGAQDVFVSSRDRLAVLHIRL